MLNCHSFLARACYGQGRRDRYPSEQNIMILNECHLVKVARPAAVAEAATKLAKAET